MEDARDAPFSTFSCWLAQSIISFAKYVNSKLYFTLLYFNLDDWISRVGRLLTWFCWLNRRNFSGNMFNNSRVGEFIPSFDIENFHITWLNFIVLFENPGHFVFTAEMKYIWLNLVIFLGVFLGLGHGRTTNVETTKETDFWNYYRN